MLARPMFGLASITLYLAIYFVGWAQVAIGSAARAVAGAAASEVAPE